MIHCIRDFAFFKEVNVFISILYTLETVRRNLAGKI